MGLAATMIILCHIRGVDFSGIPVVEKLLSLGGYGVELFLFVSGIGMYYSLTNKDKEVGSIGHWYKRRYIRILVPFLLISVSIYPLRFILNVSASWSDFLLCVTTLEYWIYHRGAWYVAMLFPLYFLTPYLFKTIYGSNLKFVAISVLITLLLTFSYVSITDCEIIRNIQFVTVRIPIFIIGIWIAPYIKHNYKLSMIQTIFIVLSGLLLMHYSNLSLGGGIAIVFLAGVFIALICKCEIINDFLSLMGKMSLESYLTNIYFGHIIMNSDVLNLSGGVKSLIVIVFGVLAAYIFNKMSNRIIDKIKKCHTSIF